MRTQVFTRDGTIELEASVSEVLPEPFGRFLGDIYISQLHVNLNLELYTFLPSYRILFFHICLPNLWTYIPHKEVFFERDTLNDRG